MNEYFYDICNGRNKLQYKMKHLNTRLHKDLSLSVLKRYCVKSPTFLQIEGILKNTFMIVMKGLDILLFYVIGNWILIILLYV